MDVKILVAEDDTAIRELLELHLKNEGYNVTLAEDGQEAIEKFETDRFDMLIIDIMMPRANGYKVLENVRENSEIPVIFLTAKGEEEDKVLGLGLGADDYIVKPFSVLEMISRVKAHLRRYLKYHTKEVVKNLYNGDISIDIKEFEAKKSGKSIELNPMQLKLLIFFMKNTGRIYTKKQLYEAVWDSEYCHDSNTIMVHISQLRDKIEDNPQKPLLIKTVKGLGYKMVKVNND